MEGHILKIILVMTIAFHLLLMFACVYLLIMDTVSEIFRSLSSDSSFMVNPLTDQRGSKHIPS
jgi:hypothetical protein